MSRLSVLLCGSTSSLWIFYFFIFYFLKFCDTRKGDPFTAGEEVHHYDIDTCPPTSAFLAVVWMDRILFNCFQPVHELFPFLDLDLQAPGHECISGARLILLYKVKRPITTSFLILSGYK